MILNQGEWGGRRMLRGSHKVPGCRCCFSRVRRDLGLWASSLGILGNDPEEGRASNYNASYDPKGTWQGKGAGDTAGRGMSVITIRVWGILGLELKNSKC
ncbi:UNVERIFIED_CONTAM: hypothetical protein K2H54_074747 [Gekko kuhli]